MDPDAIDAMNRLSEKMEELFSLLEDLAKAVLAHGKW